MNKTDDKVLAGYNAGIERNRLRMVRLPDGKNDIIGLYTQILTVSKK